MNYVKVVDEIFSQVSGVRFDILYWDNQRIKYGKGTKPAFTIIFKDEWTAKRLISQGALGFGESYMENRLQIEGDLEAYLKLRHQFKKLKPSLRLAIAAFLANRSVPNDTKDQISYHYDLGNDFFKLLLDNKTMSYSCGLYTTKKESLALAQQNKIKLVCDWLNLPPESTVLDLGCGWGGFASYAAQNHKWIITATTLSQEQRKYCEKLFNKLSLEDRISLRYQDMLEDLPDGQFDAIVMLESIEHVSRPRLNTFIRSLSAKLKPNGIIYIQNTGRYIPKRVDAWTLKYVFPGGYLPAKHELLDAASDAGLEVDKFVDDTQSYVLTMTEWINNLERNRATIEDMFDESFYRLWELWMHGAKVAFEVDSMNLFRFTLRKSV